MYKIYKTLILIILILIPILLLSCNQRTSVQNQDNNINDNILIEDLTGKVFDEFIKSKHFEIYYEKNNLSSEIYAKNFLHELEDNYNRILNFFNLKEDSIPIVKIYLYSNYEEFRNSIFEEVSFDVTITNVTGYTLGPSKFYLAYRNDRNITITAIHEFVHCVTFNSLNTELIPSWLGEGIAMYLSQDSDKYIEYYPSFAENGLPSHYELNDYDNRYIYGYSLVEYIYVEFGKEKLLELLRGGNIYDILKISEKDFSEGWRSYIINVLQNV